MEGMFGLPASYAAAGKYVHHAVGTLAKDLPCRTAVDTIAVDTHPVAHLPEHLHARLVQRAVGTDRDTQAHGAVARDDLQDITYDRIRAVDEIRAVEPVTHGRLGNPRLIVLDAARDTRLTGVHRTVGRTAELHDTQYIDLAAVGQRAVVEVGDHTLHGVALVPRAGTQAAEGLLVRAVRIYEVGLVLGHGIHHAQRPPLGIPTRIIEVAAEDTRMRRRPPRVGSLRNTLVFAQVHAVEITRVESFPPLAAAILRRQVAVVGYTRHVARKVALEGRLPPPP